MESSRGSLRFDEFPTSMSDARSFWGIRVQHAYWLRKRKTVRVSSPAPKKPARKDSAVCVSLSSYHNVKEPVGGRRMPPPEPPMEANPPLGVNDRRSVNPSLAQALLRFCPRIARSRIVPQDEETTRAKRSFKQPALACQGPGNLGGPDSFFQTIVTFRPHSCLNAPPLSTSLTAR